MNRPDTRPFVPARVHAGGVSCRLVADASERVPPARSRPGPPSPSPHARAKRLRRHGGVPCPAARLIPLAQAGQPAFINILWQSVLLGAGGPDVYRKVYVQHDAKAAGGPEMVRAFETFRRLTGYIDPGANDRKWNDTALLIQNGKAAMFINGDWAKGEFNAAGQTAGREVECAPAPGTRGQQIVIVDTFAFPKGNRPDADAARHKLVGVLMDPAVQAAFNTAKGALPARVDARMGPLDSCSRLGEEVVRTDPGKLLPGSNLAFPPDTDGQIQDLIGRFWSRPGMTAQQAAREFSRIVADVDR